MNKDEYLKHQTRANIVKSFIDKINNLEIKDIDVIASLNHYVETGDESYFKEFCDFHFMKTTEERQKIIKESAEKKKEIDLAFAKMEQYKKDYRKYLDDYKDWYLKVFESLHEDFNETGKLKLHAMGKFIEKFKKQNGHDRQVYVFVDEKLIPAENIIYSAHYNSIVMTLKGKGIATPDRPFRPVFVSFPNQSGKDFFDCLEY